MERHFGICQRLNYFNIAGGRAFRAIDNLELDPIAFLQGFEALGLDGGEVNKNVIAPVLCDETEPLGIVKPFHCTFFHCNYSFVHGFCYEAHLNDSPAATDRVGSSGSTAQN